MNEMGKVIRTLREKKGTTQKDLADRLNISDKTISKWELGKGLPDMGLMKDLACVLGISVNELLEGTYTVNENVSANMKKLHFYVCPKCGNILTSLGAGSFSCCGSLLLKQEIQKSDEEHPIHVELVEDEYCVTMNHAMSKDHYILFVAYVTMDRIEMVKLYQQQDVVVRFARKGSGKLYAYCNKHGLFCVNV